MNASRARKEGKEQFCPGDKPMDYFKRVGRTPSLYEAKCFTQGWDEAASEYEESRAVPQETIFSEVETVQHIYNTVISFTLEIGNNDDAILFLKLWNEGCWPEIKEEFPEFDLSSVGEQ